MSSLKTVCATCVCALILTVALPVQGATATITRNFKSGTVYATGTESLGVFTTGYNDYAKGSFGGGKFPKITSLSYRWSPYTNRRTKEEVRVCFRSWQQTNFSKCVRITDLRSDTIYDFNKVDFKYGGSFAIFHRLEGGIYPAIRPETGDSITITYTYGD